MLSRPSSDLLIFSECAPDNLRVLCEVHGSWYECAGIPTQFYLYVLIVAVALLMVHVVTTIVTLMYLLCPCGGDRMTSPAALVAPWCV